MGKKDVAKGLMLVGSLRKAGVTTYMKQGKMVTRVSYSEERRSNTLGQFVRRQKMRHAVALWKMLKDCEPMFTQRSSAYNNFISLANRLSAVYVPDDGMLTNASFLMPGIPVSDGTLPEVKQELGEVDGVPALLTDLKTCEPEDGERLLLYTAVQQIESKLPRVRFSMREISRFDMAIADGRYVLKGEEFADEMKGWTLVRVVSDRCSSQGIVTRCTLYHQYTTKEALEVAADSYGGLTGQGFLNGG